MDTQDIVEDEVIKGWWRRIRASEGTKIRYAGGIKLFFEFAAQGLQIGSTPRDVLEYARAQTRADVLAWRDEIEGILADFEDWLQQKPKRLNGQDLPQNLAPKTIQNNVIAVRSFLAAYNIDVPKKKGRREVKTLVENNHRLTKEIVRDAIKHADLREKALILTMLSTGMGDSEILNLRVGDFIRGRGGDPRSIADITAWLIDEREHVKRSIEEGKAEYGVTMFRIRRKKTDVDFITFATPESTLALADYMVCRNQSGWKEAKDKSHARLIEEKQRIRSADDYLFIKNAVDDWYLPVEMIDEIGIARKRQRVAEKRAELNLEGFADDVRKLDTTALMTIFRRLAKQAGLGTKDGVFQVLRGHNLRKGFSTLLQNEGVDSFIVEYWMGHKLDDQRAAYFEAIPEKLKKIYVKNMQALFVGDFETKALLSKEYEDLSTALDEHQEMLKERNGEVKVLREELDELKQQLAARKHADDLMDIIWDELKKNPEQLREIVRTKID